MAHDTLNDILTKVAAIVSQTITVTSTDDEYGLWRAYANMAQKEWAETFEWPQLYAEYNTQTSTSTGNATIALPTDFRKLAGFPKITYDGTNTADFPEISPLTQSQYISTDKYVYRLDTSTAAYLYVHPASLVSGASVFIPYWRSPASLVSPANIVDCPNADYMVRRITGLVWEAREDNRFQQANAEAARILSNLLEYENAHGVAYNDVIPSVEESKFGFRLGRD